MFLLPVVLAAALLSTVASECQCYLPVQSLASQPQIYIVGPIDSVTSQACIKNCTISASSGDNSIGVTGFMMKTFTIPSTAQMTIDVQNSDGTYLIKGINNTTNSSDPYYTYISSTPNVTIVITMSGSTATGDDWNVIGSMDASDRLNIPTTTAPPPVTTTRPPYNGPLISDPGLISNDLLIAVDSGIGQGAAGLEILKQLAQSVVNQLSLASSSTSIDSVDKTRLTLTPLNGYGTFSARGAVWGLNQSDFTTHVNAITWIPTDSEYTAALQAILAQEGPFSVSSAKYRSRHHAQRVLLIFTAAAPSDLGALSALNDKFAAMDVHPVVAGYQLSEDDQKAFKSVDGWRFENIQSAADYVKLMNDYLLNGDNLCLPPPITTYYMNDTTPDAHIDIAQPFNGYAGPTEDQTNPTWAPPQNARYCNYQKTDYMFVQTDKTTPICFQVQYELEVERDYLRFYSVGDKNQETEMFSLTGYDVTGSTFSINSTVHVRFTTDNRFVFGGFEVHAANCKTATSP